MRTDINEPATSLHIARRRRHAVATDRILEPLAVDAALADESMSMIMEHAPRPHVGRSIPPTRVGDNIQAVETLVGEDVGLLRSLADQLDLLHQQQGEIRRLLDRAGRTRLDGANA
jgi:hypothetical protein